MQDRVIPFHKNVSIMDNAFLSAAVLPQWDGKYEFVVMGRDFLICTSLHKGKMFLGKDVNYEKGRT